MPSHRSESELRAAIENLEQLLDSGATTVTQDGHTTVFKPEMARVRLRELKRELDDLLGATNRRPMFVQVNLPRS